jgi:tetratricopeptide (TPR) repeat protein
VSRFLTGLFRVSDPGEARGNSVTAREVLDKGAAEIENELKEEPEVRADLMDTMAGVYDNLGLYEQAARLARESLEFRRKVAAREPAALARTLNHLGNILMDKGDLPAAGDAYRESLERRRKDGKHREVAFTTQSLAVLLDERGQYGEAEAKHREALALQRRILGPEHPDIVVTVTNLGNTLLHAGRLEEAETAYREALAMARKFFGADSADVASVLVGLADVARRRGRLAEGEQMARESLRIRETRLGADHADTAEALVLLGRLLVESGRFSEAEAPLVRAVISLDAQKGPEARRREAREALSRLYEKWGRPEKAARYRPT